MNSFTYTKGELCWEYDKLETCMSRPEDKWVKITNMDQYSIYRKLRCALASARENVERFWGIILSGPDKP